MIVRCPSCQTQYRLDAARLRDGKGRLRCARCQSIFPVEAAPSEAPAASSAPARPAAPAPRLEVALLAAEAGPVRQRFLGVLQSLGVRTATCDDGSSALDVARRSRPVLVLATHWLPELSGAELLAALHDEPALAGARTLLIGGPPVTWRSGASVASVRGADAHVPEDAREAEIEPLIKALLGRKGGVPPGVDEPAVRAHARVAAADLLAYYGAELDEGRRAGRLHPRVADYLAAARAGCLDRFPEARFARAALAAWDDEVRRSLKRPAAG